MKLRQLCTFRLDDMHMGVDVHRVQEVLRHLDITRVPLAPAMVAGLINLRGQIVTAIDLRRRIGMAPRADGAPPMNVVVRSAEGIASLLVDEIGEVLEVDEMAFEPAPSTLKGGVRELITGVYKHADYLLSLLDVDRTLDCSGVGAGMASRGELGETRR